MDEILYSENGDYRARIVRDDWAADFKPDGCWFGTVYRLESGYYRSSVDILGQDGCVKTDVSSQIATLWDRFKDMEDVEMALRGDQNICTHCDAVIDIYGHDSEGNHVCDPDEEGAYHEGEYDFSDNPIVGFGYIDRDYGKLINVVTLRDLQHWGFESAYEFDQKFPGVDPSWNNMHDWECWADGQVFFVVLEKRVQWQRLGSDGEPVFLEDPVMIETWEEEDSCHGFYGQENAEEYARELLHHYESAVA